VACPLPVLDLRSPRAVLEFLAAHIGLRHR
jgi:hypothetical protein